MGAELITMNEMEQEDWLDRRLREAAPYIDDAGFTTRVLRSLPLPRPKREWLRLTLLLTMSILASALAYAVGAGKFVSATAVQITALPTLWIFVIALGAGILVTAGGLFAAIRTRELQF